MPDYESLYYQLFNKLTDVIEELKDFQCKMEEICIGSKEESEK